MVNGVDLGIKDQDNFTAAELAEYNGHSQCAKYLRTVENMVLFDGAVTKDHIFFKIKGDQKVIQPNQKDKPHLRKNIVSSAEGSCKGQHKVISYDLCYVDCMFNAQHALALALLLTLLITVSVNAQHTAASTAPAH